MSQKLVSEILVPPNYARAFHVNSGQTLRIIAIEGPQTGNVAVFNAHNHRDVYDPYISYELNCIQGTGNSSRIRYLHSRPPGLNLMFEVTDDPVARHWIMAGARCNQRTYEIRTGIKEKLRNCQDSLAEAIADYGMTSEDVPDILHLWMNVDYTPDGNFDVLPCRARKGDYIDFLAHMDCLVALSSCAGGQVIPQLNFDPTTPEGKARRADLAGPNKPLKAEIWEGPAS